MDYLEIGLYVVVYIILIGAAIVFTERWFK
jgi:hypothetical protein